MADGSTRRALNPDVCGDPDADGCDDCAVGTDNFGPLDDFDVANDGPDPDGDGFCNAGDTDDDGDALDRRGRGRLRHRSSGLSGRSRPTPIRDGQCDAGDPDDDNDGVADGSDSAPLNPNVCAGHRRRQL